MANPSTLYRFRVSVSDVDRAVYESLDFRVAMHPSETELYLLTRVLAYCLQYTPDLEFTQGLCMPDEPAIKLSDPDGRIRHWIEIGNPAARRLHKAAKASDRVQVYTYKDADRLLAELAGEEIHHAARLEIVAVDPAFLKRLAGMLDRDNRWELLQQDLELTVSVGEEPFHTTLRSLKLPD